MSDERENQDNTTGSDGQSLNQISDPEEYVSSRRLEQMFDLREEIHETRKKVNYAKHDSQVSQFEALSAYRAIVDSYVVEVEPIFRRYEPGPQILTDYEFGETRLQPITRNDNNHFESNQLKLRVGTDDSRFSNEWVPISEPPKPTVFEFEGLESFLNAPDPLVAVYTFKKDKKFDRAEFEYIEKGQISFDVLKEIVRIVNDFLAEIGFDVSPEESDNPAQI